MMVLDEGFGRGVGFWLEKFLLGRGDDVFGRKIFLYKGLGVGGGWELVVGV